MYDKEFKELVKIAVEKLKDESILKLLQADASYQKDSKEVCQAGGTTGIYGMTLCKTEKFSLCFFADNLSVFYVSAACTKHIKQRICVLKEKSEP